MRQLHVPAITAATFVIICTVFLGLITPTHAATRTLAWDPNPESDLAGYRIYQRILPSLNFQEIFSGMPSSPNAPQYTVAGLEPGNTYNFIVTAYNHSGDEGPPSNEVSAVIPAGSGTPPSITTQPTNITVTAPNPATFTVAATGDPPLSYQWQRNGTSIGGATSASYTLNPTSAQDQGATFAVVVSNPAGTVTSAAATLTVSTGAPALIDQSGWTLEYVDSEEVIPDPNNYPATQAFDGLDTTIWHTEFRNTAPGHPHDLIVDLGAVLCHGGLPGSAGAGWRRERADRAI